MATALLPIRDILEAEEGFIPPYVESNTTNDNTYGTCLTLETVTFKRTNVSGRSGAQLYDGMTDVTLMVNNQKLNVHKNILASQSEYFDKMFTSNFKEQNQDKIEINIDNLNYETLKTFVQFFYTSTLNITESNVQDLIIGSSVLLLDDVLEVCVDYIKTRIDSDNCLELNEMANSIPLKELHSYCMNFIVKNFHRVVQKERFVHMPYEDLLTLVKDENLFAMEDMIYDSTVKWVNYDRMKRWPYNSEFLWYCRLPFILKTYQGIPDVQHFQSAKLDSLISFRTECRKPFKKGILLLSHFPSIASPEWLDSGTNAWRCCNRVDCRCTMFKTAVKPPEYLSTTVLLNNGCMLSVGGEYKGHAMKAVYLFNPIINHWIYMPPMLYRRVKPCVVQIGSKVFVVGGCNKLSSMNTIEYYDLIVGKWVSVRSKIRGTTSAKDGIFAAHVNNLLYVICKNVAGCFDPVNNEWKSIEKMPKQRYGSAVCTLNRNIYVIGGYRGEVYHKSVWAYCTVTKKWVSIAPLNCPRVNAGVAIMNGYIYVFGGKVGPISYSNTFEVYDPLNNTWVMSNAHLTIGRNYSDAMVIEKSSDLYNNVFEDMDNFLH